MKPTQLLFLLVISLPLVVNAEWKAPANPDPELILDEAVSDARSGRYADALAKHLWFHRHALEYDKSQRGVRLSFALTYWQELGKKYPPALRELESTRDLAVKQVQRGGDDAVEAFHDVQAINEYLGQYNRTTELFIALDKDASELATKVFDIAQRDLVKSQKYSLCGKYLVPHKSYARLVGLYREQLKSAAKAKSPTAKRERLEFAENRFSTESSTLVALLVLNDRKSEAEEIAKKAKTESKSPDRNAMFDAALKGKLPKPFPEDRGQE